MAEGNEIMCEAPQTRGDCINGIRPCPWLRCSYHIFWVKADLRDKNLRWKKTKIRGWHKERPRTAEDILNNMTNDEVLEIIFNLKETCVLDVAEEGGVTLERIADILNITRERVRQIINATINRIKNSPRRINILKDYAGYESINWFGD